MNFVRLHQPHWRERFPRNGLHPEVCYSALLSVAVIRLARSWVMGTLVRINLCFPLRTPTLGSPGLVHLIQACLTKAIRHVEAHPTAHQRGPLRSTSLRARG